MAQVKNTPPLCPETTLGWGTLQYRLIIPRGRALVYGVFFAKYSLIIWVSGLGELLGNNLVCSSETAK